MRRFRLLTIAAGLLLMCVGCTGTNTQVNPDKFTRPTFKVTFYTANGDTIKTFVTNSYPNASDGSIYWYESVGNQRKLRYLLGTIEVEQQ